MFAHRVSPKSNPSLLITVIEMALEHEEDESQQEQVKRIKTISSADTSEDPQSVHIFPPEIEIEILSKLPVESLLRCKSVCKSWRSLISDPRFVKHHLSLSNSNSDYAHHRLVLCTKKSVSWCHFHDVIYDKSVNELELDYPLKHPQKTVLIAGSCNGLICLIVEDKGTREQSVFIWNPSTRKSNKLPYSGFDASVCLVYGFGYGFGYDKSSYDYKVVLKYIAKNGVKDDHRTMVYSLKFGNWKRIDDFSLGFFLDNSATFSNGALHWPLMSVNPDFSPSSCMIISLDLATETFGEVLQPVYDEGNKYLRLGVWGQRLCLVSHYSANRKSDVWVMNDYGVKDSWTKLASIRDLTDPRYPVWGSLTIVNDGKILLRCGKKLVLYDVKNGSSTEIKNTDGALVAWIIVESLVSPDVIADK